MDIQEFRGIRGLVAAKLTSDTADELTYGTPFEVAGVAQLSKNTETNSDTKYYDNVPAIVIDSTGADTVTIDTSVIPLDVLGKITGQTYDATKGMFIEGERNNDYYAIGYITKKTDGTEMFVWRLKGKFNVPDEEHQTEDNGTDSNGQQLTFTGVNTTHKFTATGKTAKAINVDQSVNPQVEATFFGTVQTPDTITAPPAAQGNNVSV